jgi:hypothetical protein
VFDGSASTGDGLIYRLEFGDGTSADTAVATRVVDIGQQGRKSARLTVTDRLGRSATAERLFFLAEVRNVSGGDWFGSIEDRSIIVRFTRRDGVNLSGWLEMPRHGLTNVPITALLTGDRDLVIRTGDGAIEMLGRIEWRDAPPPDFSEIQGRVQMRLSIRGGPADGATTLMRWDDGPG